MSNCPWWAKADESMSQPLSGLRVADFSHVMAGPFCTHFLRMLGAEVVKVEPPSGDGFRNYGPFREYDGLSPAFIAANVGKKSVVLDLKSAAGLDVARRLIAQSDVVVENFRPGVMERLGLGYEAARKLRPGLVFCSVSGYGQSGPRRDYPAIDNIVQATSGMMAANGSEGDPPSRVGWPVVDTYTGTLAALAVLGALLQRERFGSGQYIDVAMLDASIVLLTSLATPFLITGQQLPRTGDVGYSGSPTSGMFAARDGSMLSLGVVQNNHFTTLCEAIGRPELAQEARFATAVGRATPANATVLRTLLTEVIGSRDGAEWEAVFSARGVPCGLVRTVAQACEMERLTERGLLMPTHVPDVTGAPREARYVNAGFVYAQDGPGVAAAAPRIGEHTREVLAALGYANDEIQRLIDAGEAGARVPQSGLPRP
jgi:crotonobetainyl-CoA:carnitine CoA-transferase CaiB-like acyl-CoA transferase